MTSFYRMSQKLVGLFISDVLILGIVGCFAKLVDDSGVVGCLRNRDEKLVLYVVKTSPK